MLVLEALTPRLQFRPLGIRIVVPAVTRINNTQRSRMRKSTLFTRAGGVPMAHEGVALAEGEAYGARVEARVGI